jgi:hypothetical protein
MNKKRLAGWFTVPLVRLAVAMSVIGLMTQLRAATAPLTITTISPLFTATVGVAYSEQFTATGGTSPYTWSVTTGQIGSLVLDPSTGILQGTPSSTGNVVLTLAVKDAAGNVATAQFALSITAPILLIVSPASLPNAVVGTTYSQQFSATGGTGGYTWSITSGTLPGFNLDSSTGTLSAKPTTAGDYTLTVKVTDSSGDSATKTITVVVTPAALAITTPSPLPGATAGQNFSQTLTATGGVPPYTWSATGIPSGLSINSATGQISGTLMSAGMLSFTVRVTDSSQTTYVNLYTIDVALPAAPSVTLSGVPAVGQSAAQLPISVTIPNAYAGPITGTLTLAFAPAQQGATDSTIQFSTGGTSATFSIPPGQTNATFSSSPFALQTGTVAGVITLTLSVQAFGVDVTPSSAASQTITVSPAPPVVSQAQLSTSGQTITVQITGFSNTLDVSQATFSFGAAAGNSLQTSQFVVSVGSSFTTWYQDPTSMMFGSQFLYTQTFTAQGNPADVTLQSITLMNSAGASTFNVPN